MAEHWAVSMSCRRLPWWSLTGDIVCSGLTVSVWYDVLRFTPPFALVQWFNGRVTGLQLLQIIQLSISVISSAAGLYFFLWQVKSWLHVQFIAYNVLQLLHAIIAGFQTCSKIFMRPNCCSQWQRLVESRDNNNNSSSDDISDMTSPVTHWLTTIAPPRS